MKKEMKIDKEKLELEITEIRIEIDLKTIEIENSPQYKLIEADIKILNDKKREIENRFNELKKSIYGKYIYKSLRSCSEWGVIIREPYIKPSVKQGIKKGLGIKNLTSIKYELAGIVKSLIDRDLKMVGAEKINKKAKELRAESFKLYDDKEKLMKDGVSILEKKIEKISKKLRGETREEKKVEEEVKIKIKNLPKYMNKITKEINKRLTLDGLK